LAKLPKFYESVKHKIPNRDVAVNRRTITDSPHIVHSGFLARRFHPWRIF